MNGLVLSSGAVIDGITILDTMLSDKLYNRAKSKYRSCDLKVCCLFEMTSYDRHNIEKDFYGTWISLMPFKKVDFFGYQGKIWTVLPSIGVSRDVTDISIVPLKREYQEIYQDHLEKREKLGYAI